MKTHLTWFGQSLTRWSEVPLSSVKAMLPQFVREPFGANESLDMIVR